VLDSQQLNFGALKRKVGVGLLWPERPMGILYKCMRPFLEGECNRREAGEVGSRRLFRAKAQREEGLWPPVETVIGVLVPWPV
jgi:hypothetical protein